MNIHYNQIIDDLNRHQYIWLVTGGAGFIGSNLIEFLQHNGQIVRALDNYSTGRPSTIDELTDFAKTRNCFQNFVFIENDIRDLKVCRGIVEDVDYVLHQAAIGSVPRSIEEPVNTHESNINGFLNILLASKDANIKRFVYASSSSIYGDCPDSPKKEQNSGRLLSPYAVTKTANELYASVFNEVYGFKSIGLRYFNVFGNRQDPKGPYAAVIPKWVSLILNRKNIYINGDGSTTRDFCYIENAVQANILAAMTTKEEALDQVYNVALNQEISLNELFQIIKLHINNYMPEVEVMDPIYRKFRTGDIKHSRADISKAERLLGYAPTKTALQGLRELIKMECKK